MKNFCEDISVLEPAALYVQLRMRTTTARELYHHQWSTLQIIKPYFSYDFVTIIVFWSLWQERVRDSPSPSPSLEEAQMSSNHSSSVSSSPSHTERAAETTRTYSPVRSAQVAEGHFGCNETCERFLRVIVILTFYFPLQTHRTTGCHQVTMCWDIPQVWCREAETQMWSTARRTRGATLTEVLMFA